MDEWLLISLENDTAVQFWQSRIRSELPAVSAAQGEWFKCSGHTAWLIITDCSIYVAPRGDVLKTLIVQQVEWRSENNLLCGYCI